MDKREPKNPISAQLSRAIKKHGHTQEEVGQILDVSSSTVSSMIHGKAVKTLTKIMSKVRQYINNGVVTSELEEVKAPGSVPIQLGDVPPAIVPPTIGKSVATTESAKSPELVLKPSTCMT